MGEAIIDWDPFSVHWLWEILKNVSWVETYLTDSLHRDFRIPELDSSFIQWNLVSGFQSLVGFRIPWVVLRIPNPRISDSTSKNFPQSGIGISLHEATENELRVTHERHSLIFSMRARWNKSTLTYWCLSSSWFML